MAHWYQVARSLGRRNPRESGHFQRIPLGILRQCVKDFLRHLNERRRFCLSTAGGFARDIHHLGATSRVIVRELAAVSIRCAPFRGPWIICRFANRHPELRSLRTRTRDPLAPAFGADGQSVRNGSEGPCVFSFPFFTATPPSPARLLPASLCPEAPQDSSLPAPPPAYRLIPARAPLRLRDRLTRHPASPEETWLNQSWS